MLSQETTHPGLQIPCVLVYLSESIVDCGGYQTEGVWRIPGDVKIVGELKSRIDRKVYGNLVSQVPIKDGDGQTDISRLQTGVKEPHVLATLDNMFIRELPEPLIPEDLANRALETITPWYCCQLIPLLDELPRRILLYTISFLQ